MRILHIAPNSPYNDYWGYQDNLLPKYQRRLGHEVAVITTTMQHENGKIINIKPTHYFLDDGTEVYRMDYIRYRFLPGILSAVAAKLNVYDIVVSYHPDFIFYHGLVSCTIFDVVKYKKENPQCVVVQDNHWDYNIGNKTVTVKQKILRLWYRILNRYSIRYVEKVYGVTPWRKTYAEDYFRIPSSKTDVLIMGADDEKLRFDESENIRKRVRDTYGIKNADFLIVTGGKLDKNKKTIELMKACRNTPNVKLLIFGNVLESIREIFQDTLDDCSNCTYIGWIDADMVYDYFFAADLVCFPGQHSVLWEQACASKVPCVFEEWEGMDHVDNGGNSDFVTPVTEDTLRTKIMSLLFTEKYYSMKAVAKSSKTDLYLYSKIAEKSLECVSNGIC